MNAALPTIGILLITARFMALAQDDPPPPPPNRTYFPQIQFTVNELLYYRMSASMSMSAKMSDGKAVPIPNLGGEAVKSEATFKVKTVGIKPDGTGVLITTVTSGRASVLGTSTDTSPNSPPTTMEIDKRGRLIKIRGLEKIEGMDAVGKMMNLNNLPGFGVVLPDQPVKIGDTWEMEMPFFVGTGKMKYRNTLVGVESVEGKETLKIRQEMTMPMDFKFGQGGL